MNTKKDLDPRFQVLRDSPTEFSLQEIDRMVVGFPALPSSFDWSTIINLKSIIMSSICALFLAGAVSLLSGSDSPSTIQVKSYQEEPTVQIQSQNEPEELESLAESPSQVKSASSSRLPDPIPAILPLNPSLPNVHTKQGLIAPYPVPSMTSNSDRDYDLKDFHSVSLSTSVDIIIKQGGEFHVSASGDPKLIEELELEVKGGHLEVGEKSGKRYWNSNYKATTVYITMPFLDDLSVAGSGTITFEGFSTADVMHLSLAGSGDILGKSPINITKNLKVSVAGSGNISVSGSTQMLDASIAGSGDFDGKDLHASKAKVSIAGSGDVFIHCNDELDVSIAGSGDVNYSGDAHVTKSIVGSGEANHH